MNTDAPVERAPRRIRILGVPVDIVTPQSARNWCREQLGSNGSARTIMAVNPEKVIRAHHEPALLEALEQSDLLIPDGAGIIWAARLLGLGSLQRVTGADLMPVICELASEAGHPVYLYGSTAEHNARASTALLQRYPDLIVAGHHHGYVPAGRSAQLVEAINRSGAQILFVALGSPQQELWLAAHRHELQVRLCQSVGGSFDVLAGAVERAPRWLREHSFEWLYRLARQPARWQREWALAEFALKTLRARLGRRR